MTGPIIVVCGLKSEAAIAAGPDIVTVIGGGDRAALERRLAAAMDVPAAAIVSFGLAGALESGLRPGTVVIPWRVSGDGRSYDTSRAMVTSWLPRFDTPSGVPRFAWRAPDLVGVDAPVLSKGAKSDLGFRSQAGAVDMESHVAAAFAERRSLPFAVLRVISDPADRSLPPVVGEAMLPDGSTAVGRILAGLARHPGQLPGLIRTARDYGGAMRVLGGVRRLLGPRFGLHL